MIAFKTLFLFSAGVCVCVCVCVCVLDIAAAAAVVVVVCRVGKDRGGVPELHKIFKMFPTLLSGVSGQAMAVAVGV